MTSRTVVLALYHDDPPVTLVADLRTEELVVHLGTRPVVLELAGFTATWDLLTPVGVGSFEVRRSGRLVMRHTLAQPGPQASVDLSRADQN